MRDRRDEPAGKGGPARRTLPIAAVLVFGLVVLGTAPGVTAPKTRLHPLDGWLSTHPEVAATLVWEFPPTRNVPVVKPRPIYWPFRGPGPDPVFVEALNDIVFSDLIGGRSPVPGRDEPVEGLAAAQGTATLGAALPQPLPVPIPGGIKTSEYGAEIRAWKQWPDWAKEELRDRYDAYAAWLDTAWPLYELYAASGFTTKPPGFDAAFTTLADLDPSPLPDPPVNLQPDDPLVDGVPWAMVDSPGAFGRYVRLVAAQLAIEVGRWLPWSLADYAVSDLVPLFDGRLTFRYVPQGPTEWGTMTSTGHILTTTVTPAPPLVVLGFLAQNALVGADRADTLVRLLDWERQHLVHVKGGATAVPLASGVLYFGYNGRPPVSRMINGTIMAAPVMFPGGAEFFDPEVRHWVGGCSGASGFNEQVLRLVNMAAERQAFAHFQNRFSLDYGVHVGLAHADDPYSVTPAPEIPTADILLDEATYQAWFVNEPDPAVRLANVGRRVADLYLQYLPEYLVFLHCLDLALNNDHAGSRVYNAVFANSYTVTQMEAMGLWTGLEAKLAELGGCEAVW